MVGTIKAKMEQNVAAIGFFMLIVHISGAIGMMTPARMYFLALTPVNLVISFALILYFHPRKSPVFWRNVFVIVVFGFLIELIGVNTGWPFGIYQYEWAFGPQLWNTPIVIGLNWFVMTYGGVYFIRRLFSNELVTSFITGLCVTLLDVILEPVAIYSSYWTWASERVPLSNYVTWFVCISVFAFLIIRSEKIVINPIVKWILGGQVVFFVTLCIYYLYF